MDFRYFDNYPSKRMRFLRSHDTLSLFLHDIMTCMHISKKYNEIHGGRTNLTIRKHAKILTTPSQILAKNSRYYRYSRFHSFQAHSESILWICPSTAYFGLYLRGAMSAVTGIYLFRLLLILFFCSEIFFNLNKQCIF